MKKTFIVSMLVLLVPALVFAYFQPATLINGSNRVAVTTQEMAQRYFGMGYVLEGTKPVVKVCDCENLGAAGQVKTERQFLNGGLTTGGYKATTSAVTMSAKTLTTTELPTGVNVISWTPNLNITLTLGGTSTRAFVPNTGDVANVYFYNATTTDAATITFAAADTNVDLQMAEATGGDLILNGKDWAKLTFIRRSATVVTVIFDEMTEAD